MRGKKAAYNIITNLFLQVIVILYGFIVPKIIIRCYGSDVNGLISSITQFLAYISLLESGFGPVVKATLYKPLAKKDNKSLVNILKTSEKFFRTVSYIFLAYILLLCFFYPLLVSKNFNFIFTFSLIIIIAISTFAEYFFGMTYRLLLQADQKSYIISIIQIVTYIISTIIIVILARIGASIQLIKLLSSIIFVFRPIIQNYYVKKNYNINLKDADDKYELKQKWDGLAQHIASVIHTNTDITILTIFASLAEVSVYSVYYLVIKGLKSIIQAFNSGIDASFGDMLAKNEISNLTNKFNLYEVMYFTIMTIVFSCSLILITPFISVYTSGITDTNYIRFTFGYLLVISEYIWAIRQPYNELIKAAGHFKETRKGAWIEALSNIFISIVLVYKFGIVGVTIGTIVAMSIRTIEFVYHTNKYILNRNMLESIKKIFVITIETIIIFIISIYLPYINNISYANFAINGLITGIISCTVIIGINSIIYKTDMDMFYKIIKKIIKR